MTFREILQRLVDQTPGARGAALIDGEGIALDEYTAPGEELDLAGVAVEFQAVLAQASKAASRALGERAALGEAWLRAGDQHLLLRRVDDEIFLIALLRRDALVGKARYLADLLLPDLRSAL
jgi:predicted regulator of Ras-like GTPase activity (Roadblock/LC7/MglB family)